MQSDPCARTTLTGTEQSVMLLVESLIHGLIDRSVLSPADAIEIIDRAVEIRREIGEHAQEDAVVLAGSFACLTAMSGSLSHDVPTDAPHQPDSNARLVDGASALGE